MDNDCPRCGKEGSMIHVKVTHYGICTSCKVGWLIGRKIFTVPKEVQDKHDENLKYLQDNFEYIE